MSHSVAVSESVENEHQQAPVIENLVDWMNTELANAGHPDPRAWMAFLKPGVDTLEDPKYQAFEINRAWRVVFARIATKGLLTAEESMDVRYSAFIDMCPIDSWKEAIVKGALPCILRHNLPSA